MKQKETKRTPAKPKRPPEAPTETVKRLRMRLKTPEDCARAMARCVRTSLRGGEAESNRGYKIVTMLAMLSKTLEAAEVDKRLRAIERIMDSNALR